MKFSTILQIAFLLLATLLLVTVLVYQRFDKQVQYNLVLAESSDSLHEKFDRINIAIQTAQKSQRGYLLTGNEKLLAGYKDSLESLPPSLFNLYKTIQFEPMPEQVRLIVKHDFRKLYDLWVQLHESLSRSIELVKNQEEYRAIDIIKKGDENKLAEDIASLVNGVEAHLSEINDQSVAQIRTTTEYLASLFWAFLLALFMAGLAILLLHNKRVETPLSKITDWLKYSKSRNLPLLMDKNLADPQVKAIQQALVHFHSALEKANKDQIDLLAKQLNDQIEFTSVLAHEIRTPLTTMLGIIALGKREGLFDHNPVGYDKLEKSASDLVEVVNCALDYQRMKQGNYEVVSMPIESANFMAALLEKERKSPLAKGLEIAGMDELETSELILGDESKIRQIMTNIMNNAIKFTPSGGKIFLTSQLEKSQGQEEWVLSVADTGIGISENERTTIFEPFKQIDAGAQRKYGGTGLGLALSQEMARALGGKITVESTPKVGSRFTLRVPVKTVRNADQIETVQKAGTGMEDCNLDLSGMTALMIEDHPLNAKINSKLVERDSGCKIAWAATAEAGIDLIKQGNRYDLIFMDINLGEGMTGLEATVYLVEMLGDRCPPIVALTAGILASDQKIVFDVGMKGFIEKPLTKGNMNKVLGNLFPTKIAC